MSLLATVLFVSCEKEEKATISTSATIETEVSATEFVLDKNNADNEALVVTAKLTGLGVVTPLKYAVVFSYQDLVESVDLPSGKKTLTVSELNKVATSLGLPIGVATQVKVSTKATAGAHYDIKSTEKTITISRYLDLISPTEWGVVGSITEWGNTGIADIPFWKVIGSSTQYVAYFTVTSNGSEIKFRKNSSWSENYGDDGANGTLEASGANIAIDAGTYRVLWDISANTYTIENYAWGIVGGAANGWDESNTDIPLSYDGTIDSWVAKDVVLKDGEIKFRFNNKWGGDKGGATNALKGSLGGSNIKVTAGTYTITVNFTDETYSIVAQ